MRHLSQRAATEAPWGKPRVNEGMKPGWSPSRRGTLGLQARGVGGVAVSPLPSLE